MKTNLNILILSESDQSKLVDSCIRRGHTPIVRKPTDHFLFISSNPAGWDSIYYEDEATEKIKLRDIDCIVGRIGSHREYATSIVEHLQHNLGIWCLQSANAINTCADKVKTAQKCSQAKLRVPRQFYAFSPKDANFLIDKLGGLPVILKETTGSCGNGIILLESVLQSNLTLESFYRKEIRFILQEFIDNGGKDLRVIVVGDKVVSAMERSAPKGEVRANLSQAGTARKVDLDKETEKMCIDAVAAIPGLNFAGVDLMQVPHEGEIRNYLIEMNSNPGSLIIDVTGHNYFNDILDYIEQNHTKTKSQVSNQVVVCPSVQYIIDKNRY